MNSDFSLLLYLCASVCFIFALKGLSSAASSRQGNMLGMLGMFLAISVTIMSPEVSERGLVIAGLGLGGVVGAVIARKIHMTALPQLMAAFHSLVGLAAVCVALSALFQPDAYGIGYVGDIKTASLIEMSLGVIVGAMTFTGSIVAFLKLQGILGGKPAAYPFQHQGNALLGGLILVIMIGFVLSESYGLFYLLIALSLLIGVLIIIPIGGADMPVVISMLNSYSGWAAAGIGFTMENHMLIITGALVGSSGAILSYIMCKAMNRSLVSVVLGGFGAPDDITGGVTKSADQRTVKQGSAEDAGFILKNSESVIIVPGYGMAVAQAQHALREMADLLKGEGIKVRYAIHPVAGRMPGHMNVLLAEANVPYEDVLELDDINRDFTTTDTVVVIGANDITNPVAKTDPQSPIYGMPILDVLSAKTVLFIKRSLSPGYAGIDNDVFYRDNTLMLFGDAKKMTEEVVKCLG